MSKKRHPLASEGTAQLRLGKQPIDTKQGHENAA
jgi:hypothetical protein